MFYPQSRFIIALFLTAFIFSTFGYCKEKETGERRVVTIKGVDFAFRWCPAGKFMMGALTFDEQQTHFRRDEKAHEVTLTKGFWMMETEVTQKQWKAIMGSNPSVFYTGDDLPVGSVSWFDCQEFCKKCKQLGFPFQLPTESQWEYACRAGTTEAYAGNLDDMAWYSPNHKSTIHPVGTKKPNAWGLYDMHGNVSEWCQDWYGESPYINAPVDPVGPSYGSYRVLRGGCMVSHARDCRSAFRSGSAPANSFPHYGFRCIVVP